RRSIRSMPTPTTVIGPWMRNAGPSAQSNHSSGRLRPHVSHTRRHYTMLMFENLRRHVALSAVATTLAACAIAPSLAQDKMGNKMDKDKMHAGAMQGKMAKSAMHSSMHSKMHSKMHS